MEWNGMEWNGMEWNGMEWNEMEYYKVRWVRRSSGPSRATTTTVARPWLRPRLGSTDSVRLDLGHARRRHASPDPTTSPATPLDDSADDVWHIADDLARVSRGGPPQPDRATTPDPSLRLTRSRPTARPPAHASEQHVDAARRLVGIDASDDNIS